jgi:hypothetical protein
MAWGSTGSAEKTKQIRKQYYRRVLEHKPSLVQKAQQERVAHKRLSEANSSEPVYIFL